MPRRSSASTRRAQGGLAASLQLQQEEQAGAAAASMMPGAGAGGGQAVWTAAVPSEEAVAVGSTGAATVVPPLPLPTPPAPAKGRVCIPCRMARVRCDLNVPCERCFRLCIQCKQSVRKPYTRRQEAEEADEEEGREEGASASADSSSNGAAKHKGGRKRGREEAAAAIAAEPPPLDSTPLPELIVKRNDPSVAASLYIKSFQRLLQEGRIIRDRVLAVLRIWRVWSLAAGVDVTWGIIGEITRALRINPVELEGKEAVRWGMAPERRSQRAYRQIEGMERVSKALTERTAFRQADDGVTPMFMFVIGGPPPDDEAAWGSEEAAICFQACNAPLVALLQAAAFSMYGALRYKAIQTLTTLGFLAPGDREQYLLRLQELLFTDARAISDIFKASFGDGNVRLYLFRARRIELEGEGQQDRICVVHYVEPCPASRHVTDMPEALKTRVVKYHKPYQPGSMQAPLPPKPEPPHSSSSVGSSTSCATSSGASSALTHALGCPVTSGPAGGPVRVHIPAVAAVPSLMPAAAAGAVEGAAAPLRFNTAAVAAAAAAADAVDPAGLFGARDGRQAIEGAGVGGGASVKEEAKDHGHEHEHKHEHSPLLAPVAADDASTAAATHQPPQPHPHFRTPSPPPSPALVPTPPVAVALGAFPTSAFESLSPPLSPSMSMASSLSEEVMVGDRGGAGAGGGMGVGLGGGQAQGQVDCGNGVRPPPWLPAVPVFDEAGMESIFD